MTEPPPPPRDRLIVPPTRSHLPKLILHRPPPTLHGSLGFTLNKRQSIEREKSGHTPVRKKHAHTTCRASSVQGRVAIQEALSAEMSSLHVDDSLSGRVELLDDC